MDLLADTPLSSMPQSWAMSRVTLLLNCHISLHNSQVITQDTGNEISLSIHSIFSSFQSRLRTYIGEVITINHSRIKYRGDLNQLAGRIVNKLETLRHHAEIAEIKPREQELWILTALIHSHIWKKSHIRMKDTFHVLLVTSITNIYFPMRKSMLDKIHIELKPFWPKKDPLHEDYRALTGIYIDLLYRTSHLFRELCNEEQSIFMSSHDPSTINTSRSFADTLLCHEKIDTFNSEEEVEDSFGDYTDYCTDRASEEIDSSYTHHLPFDL